MEKEEKYDFYGLGIKYGQEQYEKVEDMIEDYRINYGGEAAREFALGVTKGLEAFKSLRRVIASGGEPEDPSELFDNARDDLRNYR